MYPRGYVFGRTGWGENRAFEDEVFTSMRFGPVPTSTDTLTAPR